jgi:hypothetical protein
LEVASPNNAVISNACDTAKQHNQLEIHNHLLEALEVAIMLMNETKFPGPTASKINFTAGGRQPGSYRGYHNQNEHSGL